ncbi:cercosporin resistance [Pyrenophora seminiperda CCB06]|uniref:Cercosporin resistance n=1 Tax=Pyrenophora seminiperda CCB06 TaxID=1302712 RepID=A0A3M7M7D3_9PLEO|nr:cercosporin resistance [Pyrenophora seminiperda CCB06]
MRKRLRACEECHRLKIKCDISTNPDAASCDRCQRNNLECVPAAPRLQRDRISELEAQIQELTNALQERNALQEQGSSSTTPSFSPGSLSTTLSTSRSPASPLEGHDDAALSVLDARIPPMRQQHLLYLYSRNAGVAWPAIRLPMELDHLRAKCPVLLLAVITYTITQEAQGVDLEVNDDLVRETVRILGDEVIGKGQRSLELVQALLTAALWNKSTRRGLQGSCYQIVQLASDMAIDLGIAGFSLQPSPVAYFCRHPQPTSLDARRTWLACYVASSSSSISTRRPSPVPWDSYHQDCVLTLENNGNAADILFCQIVRILRLQQEISNHLCLCQIATFVDGNDYNTYSAIEVLKAKVDAWAAEIPPSLASSQTLKVFWHITMIHLYELVLHTPTNKASFAAPFIPGRIPIKDFPRPVTIIPPLKTALERIVQHCHAVVDTAAEMDPALILSLPSFCFSPTVVYALFVLVTTLVAATAPDPRNTYGQCLPKDCFRIEQCGLKLRTLAAYMKALDPTLSCFTTRMIDATSWLEEWYNDYSAILRRYETNFGN